MVDEVRAIEAAIARAVTVPLTDGQHGALVSFAFNLGHSIAAGKPLANIAATLNRGDYDGALRRMGLYVKQRQNGRLVIVPGLVNRRAAEAGLWARGEFVASRHVAPAAPPTEGTEAAKLGGYAAAAATAAPALQALAGATCRLATNSPRAHSPASSRRAPCAGARRHRPRGSASPRCWPAASAARCCARG